MSSLKLNRLASAVKTVERYLPKSLHSLGYTFLFNNTVKLAGTAGIRINELSQTETKVTLRNRRKIQNHIGGLHACSMALAAESATGIVMAMNIPDSKLLLLKTMKINYIRQCQGDIVVSAWLTNNDIQQCILEKDKGDVTVPVQVQDESGNEPLQAEMIWAWVDKKK